VIAQKSNGSVWVWGANSSGQFGNGTTTLALNPLQLLLFDSSPVADFSSGLSHAIVINETRSTYCGAGSNINGQLGDGSTVNQNTFTCANVLPLSWHSFTAQKQQQSVLLNWETSTEQNTKEFLIQTSLNGTNWVTIGTIKATGYSSDLRSYKFIHLKPVTGSNYYRIEQTDFDGKSSYSAIRLLKFKENNNNFIILGNPVTNGRLSVNVNEATTLRFYTADGKLLWQENVNTGTKTFDVSRYAKSIYLLKSNNSTQKVVLQ
jgi:uncharacterized protein YjbK